MTETQYLSGLMIYGGGALGCYLAAWWAIHRWPTRLKRFILMGLLAALFTPAYIVNGKDFLGSAALISLYDALSINPEAAWRTGYVAMITASIAAIIGLLLPVHKKVKKAEDEQEQREADSKHDKSSQPNAHKEPSL